MEHKEISLDAAVREVRRLADRLESGAVGDEGSAECQAQIQRTLGLCGACENAVARGGFFSANEELDDIPTHSLLLLLLPYYAAVLTLHVRTRPNPTGDVQRIVERTAVLADVRHTLRDFVQRMRDLGVLAKEDCAVTLAALDADIAAMADGAPPPRTSVDAAAARSEKISAFRRKKVTRALLDQIAQRRADRRKHRGIVSATEEEEHAASAAASAAAASAGAGTRVYVEEDEGSDDDDDDDEETGRQLRVTALKYAALVALDELGGVVREEAMLTEIARMKARGTFEAVRAREAQELAAKRASAQRPFTVTRAMLDARERYARDVFKPFNPATLMPDDPAALAADDALSGVREEARRRAAGLPAEPDAGHTSADDDSDRETDESLRKARAWDDFKDSNPRGWGNTIGMG